MATQPKGKTQVAYTISGNSPHIIYMREGTPTWTSNLGAGALGKSSTGYFKAGACLYLNSTEGLDVMLGGDGIATGYDSATTNIVGIAMENGTGTSTNEVAIAMAVDDNVFIANVGSQTSVATATVSVADMYIKGMGASVNSSSFYVNTTSSAGASVCTMIGLLPGDSYGDTYGRVFFKFLPANNFWADRF